MFLKVCGTLFGSCTLRKLDSSLCACRSTHWNLARTPKGRAKTSTYPRSTLRLAHIVSCSSFCIRFLLIEDSHIPIGSSGASLTLAYGRRYGLIGRNGVGTYILGACEAGCLPLTTNFQVKVHCYDISPCEKYPSQPTSPSCLSNKRFAITNQRS